MKALLYPSYFPSISQMAVMVQAEELVFEMEDNFQKQTNRNRMYIYSPNGKQLLNVPVKHSKEGHQKTKDVQIEKAFEWQKLHFKSMEAAYRSSPYFEYFEDAIAPLYFKRHKFLMDLNLETLEVVWKCLGYRPEIGKTTEYFHQAEGDIFDFRPLVNGKKDPLVNSEYTQVFQDKYGFLPNLSILDLLCAEGRHALKYLREIDTKSLIV